MAPSLPPKMRRIKSTGLSLRRIDAPRAGYYVPRLERRPELGPLHRKKAIFAEPPFRNNMPEDKTLLIVEDDRPLRERLARAMEARGFSVSLAESVAEGRARAKE